MRLPDNQNILSGNGVATSRSLSSGMGRNGLTCRFLVDDGGKLAPGVGVVARYLRHETEQCAGNAASKLLALRHGTMSSGELRTSARQLR